MLMDGDVKLLDVYTKQIEMSGKLDNLIKLVPDHETRIRKLEAWKNAIPLATITSLGSIALAIFELLHH